MIHQADFILSTAKPEQFPELPEPEIAFVGRSNVGKSSLLNHLTNNKKLAFVSSKPGKTQLINFFSIDKQVIFVDLPGYGFAKTSKKLRESWGDLIQSYLAERKNLGLILLLIDLRHPPSEEDLLFAKWATYYKKPLLMVLTKADKLRPNEVHKNTQKNLALLQEAIGDTPFSHVVYSIKDPRARKQLLQAIKSRVPWD